MQPLNHDEITRQTIILEKFNLCLNSNEVSEFSKNFNDYVNFLKITNNPPVLLSIFCEILKTHKKPEICKFTGLELFMKSIREGGEYKFIHDQEYISLEKLRYLDFGCFSSACLDLIKKKIEYFLRLWMNHHNDDYYNYNAMNKLYVLLVELHDNNETTIFNKISKLKLILDLVLIIDKPYIIEQPPNTNLCGPAAILTYICAEMPEQFIMMVKEFFYTGKIDKPFTMLASEYSKNNDNSVIIAMMVGMKHSNNYYLGYNNKILNKKFLNLFGWPERYCGLTEPNQMVDWLQSLGCSDLYEDLTIHVPLTRYDMPRAISNLLLWRQVYSVNHKTVVNSTDRLPILEEFIASSSYKKIILLCCEDFWFDIIKNYYKEKYNYIVDENARHRLNIGHYVYLHSLNITIDNKFECVFYGDGKLIKTVVDKTIFLKGLKGVISMTNFLEQQEFMGSRINKRKRSEKTQAFQEQPVKRQKIC